MIEITTSMKVGRAASSFKSPYHASMWMRQLRARLGAGSYVQVIEGGDLGSYVFAVTEWERGSYSAPSAVYVANEDGSVKPAFGPQNHLTDEHIRLIYPDPFVSDAIIAAMKQAAVAGCRIAWTADRQALEETADLPIPDDC